MKHFLIIFVSLLFLVAPSFVLADAGHAEGTAHGTTQGTVHIHDDGTIEGHNDSAFVLSTPWSPRWWMLLGISLILMGFLSMWVQRYLQVQ